MPNARPDNTKKDIIAIATKYGIEVVGFLGLDNETTIPAAEMDLLKGVKWADKEVDISNVKNPVEIMPSARTMVILGKRLMDDGQDVYYLRIGDRDLNDNGVGDATEGLIFFDGFELGTCWAWAETVP